MGYSRSGYTSNAAGDLAYMPNQRAQGHRMVSAGAGGRSFSDVDYNVHHNPQYQANRQPMVYNSQVWDELKFAAINWTNIITGKNISRLKSASVIGYKR